MPPVADHGGGAEPGRGGYPGEGSDHPAATEISAVAELEATESDHASQGYADNNERQARMTSAEFRAELPRPVRAPDAPVAAHAWPPSTAALCGTAAALACQFATIRHESCPAAPYRTS
jgi:hypothetical protein